MRLGKMLSVGEVVEQAMIEEPPPPAESVEKTAPVVAVEEPAEPAVAHAEG
jgi:hypothetical protein